MADLKDLVELSRLYGGDPEYVLLGGGNTSMKDGRTLYVKASGFPLGTIEEEGFVQMDLEALGTLWEKTYPEDPAAREAAVLADMMASRLPGQTARPSVEALLHSLVEGTYVIHTHPPLVNGLTCGRDGEKIMEELFGSEALWVPLMEPGYILAKEIRRRLAVHQEKTGVYPRLIFLQNHGLFISGSHREEILRRHREVREKILQKVTVFPEKDWQEVSPAAVGAFRKAGGEVFSGEFFLASGINRDSREFAGRPETIRAIELPFNPDQIVYAGPGPCFAAGPEQLPEAAENYRRRWNREPVSFLLADGTAFGAGPTGDKAAAALALLGDAMQIAVYSRSFGGPQPMSERLIHFILNWEVEHFRAKVL